MHDDDIDETNTDWWTESQISNVIHTSEPGRKLPEELFSGRPSELPSRTATVRDREPTGVFRSLINRLRGC